MAISNKKEVQENLNYDVQSVFLDPNVLYHQSFIKALSKLIIAANSIDDENKKFKIVQKICKLVYDKTIESSNLSNKQKKERLKKDLIYSNDLSSDTALGEYKHYDKNIYIKVDSLKKNIANNQWATIIETIIHETIHSIQYIINKENSKLYYKLKNDDAKKYLCDVVLKSNLNTIIKSPQYQERLDEEIKSIEEKHKNILPILTKMMTDKIKERKNELRDNSLNEKINYYNFADEREAYQKGNFFCQEIKNKLVESIGIKYFAENDNLTRLKTYEQIENVQTLYNFIHNLTPQEITKLIKLNKLCVHESLFKLINDKDKSTSMYDMKSIYKDFNQAIVEDYIFGPNANTDNPLVLFEELYKSNNYDMIDREYYAYNPQTNYLLRLLKDNKNLEFFQNYHKSIYSHDLVEKFNFEEHKDLAKKLVTIPLSEEDLYFVFNKINRSIYISPETVKKVYMPTIYLILKTKMNNDEKIDSFYFKNVLTEYLEKAESLFGKKFVKQLKNSDDYKKLNEFIEKNEHNLLNFQLGEVD